MQPEQATEEAMHPYYSAASNTTNYLAWDNHTTCCPRSTAWSARVRHPPRYASWRQL